MERKTKEILHYFESISRIPRCSMHVENISSWLKNWFEERRLSVRKDSVGNVVVNIPGNRCHEDAPTVVIQSHMDMVCEKNMGSMHDFTKDSISCIIEGEWLYAPETSLGADNGIGMAMAMMAGLDKDLVHPPLELLFTVDEESSFGGARSLSSDFIKGRVLLNIDSEDEGVFTIGCAGGNQSLITLPLVYSELDKGEKVFEISVVGAKGGHSGIDISLGRANANKLIARTLMEMMKVSDLKILKMEGGTAHNAIPREAWAIVACSESQYGKVEAAVRTTESVIRADYDGIEKNISLHLGAPHLKKGLDRSLDSVLSRKLVRLLLAMPHGVVDISSGSIKGIVTSNNLATVKIYGSSCEILSSQRSSSMSRLRMISERVASIAILAGAKVMHDNEYEPWSPNLRSPLLQRSKKIYNEMFQKDPVIEVIHAGLECSIFSEKYQGMDMLSIGPTIQFPHSPDERLYIPSIIKVWNLLEKILESYSRTQED